MAHRLNPMRQVIQATQTVLMRVAQVIGSVRMRLRSHTALAAETLFFQRQLALYQDQNGISQREMNATRFTLVWLSYWFDWEPALTIVHPQTFKRWRRRGWRLLLTQPAKLGRPPIPAELQALIRRMARENMTWSQKRIANELLLKLGLQVSPRTVRKYMPRDCVGDPGRRCQSQRWSTCIRNHAKGLVVMGVTAEMDRRAKAMLARIRRPIESLTNWASQRSLSPIKTHNQLVIFRLEDSSGLPVVVSLNLVEYMKCVERSPPEKEMSRNPEPMSSAPALPVARVEVRSAMLAHCRRARLRPKAPGIASALSSVNRSGSLPKAA